MGKDKDKSLKELLQSKRNSADYTLTAEEFDTLIEALGDSEKQAKVAKQLGLNSTDDLLASIQGILGQASNSENYFARLEKKMKRGEIAEELSAGLGVAKDLFQLGVGARQISESNRTLRGLKRPALPGLPSKDRTLSNAISEAQRGTMDAARAVEPARQGIERGFGTDLAAARGAVGGQSGAYGSLAQTAALRRNRAFGEIAPMIDSIRAREQGRLDQLLGQRLDQRQQDFRNRFNLYDEANQNYVQDAGAAAELGLAGRENLYGAVGNLSGSLANLGGVAYQNPRFRNKFKLNNGRTGIKEVDDFQDVVYSNPYYNLDYPSQKGTKMSY